MHWPLSVQASDSCRSGAAQRAPSSTQNSPAPQACEQQMLSVAPAGAQVRLPPQASASLHVWPSARGSG
jgi:hypothetical protein